MAFTLKLSESNDLTITRGKLDVVAKSLEVRQRIIVSLKHNWQEYFLNVDAGMPWYEVILGSKDRPTAEALIRWTISQVPGVVSIIALETTLSGRECSIYAAVEVLDGATITINETVGG